MDINAFLQKELQEKKEELERRQPDLQRKIEYARAWLEAIKARTDFPEQTDTLEKLKKANGRTVELSSGFAGKETASLELKNGIILAGGVSYPLIGEKGQGIERMIDAETGEVIFDNPYYNDDMAVQYGMLFGKEAAVKEAEAEVEACIRLKEIWEKNFEETKEAVKKVPTWIKKGEKFIYPQRADRWQECVAKRATDLYKGIELDDALEIMEVLADGVGTIEQAKEIFDKDKSPLVIGIVANFSKRGPEFYREVEHENPEWLQKIEKENQTFERELSGGGKQ